MLALQHIAHTMSQVPPELGQEYSVAGIGVLVVLITGLCVQLFKIVRKKFNGQEAGEGEIGNRD